MFDDVVCDGCPLVSEVLLDVADVDGVPCDDGVGVVRTGFVGGSFYWFPINCLARCWAW